MTMRHHVWQAVPKLITYRLWGNVVQVLENRIRVSYVHSILLRIITYSNVFYFSVREYSSFALLFNFEGCVLSSFQII